MKEERRRMKNDDDVDKSYNEKANQKMNDTSSNKGTEFF